MVHNEAGHLIQPHQVLLPSNQPRWVPDQPPGFCPSTANSRAQASGCELAARHNVRFGPRSGAVDVVASNRGEIPGGQFLVSPRRMKKVIHFLNFLILNRNRFKNSGDIHFQ
ncbi:hypothetical protein CRG98_002108 [Punica granatum]|uniref:Uncharacterized protein n=1 Tax=Punica granatum TaxID=22663 RepID=A0A2I0L9Y3_PUNGR|nr:hypothetical protein CRG98_002108 [Punica granatum]